MRFQASRGSHWNRVVGSWPEVVQYPLSTYETPVVMREAMPQVYNLRQAANEVELVFSKRLSTAICRCRNIFKEPQNITMFIHGLIPEIQSLVARSSEGQR